MMGFKGKDYIILEKIVIGPYITDGGTVCVSDSAGVAHRLVFTWMRTHFSVVLF